MSERALDHLIDALFAAFGLGLLCASLHLRQAWLLLGLIPLAFAGASFIQKLCRHAATRRQKTMEYRLSGDPETPTTPLP